ncbi:MAG: hypothetical protein ABR499_22055 [Gemmatimonadaceae bacterium]
MTASACHSAARPPVVTPPSTASPAPPTAERVRHAFADSVRLVTSDIPNFWRAYDLAAGKDSAERVRIFEELYLRPGSAGLRDWIRARLVDNDVVRRRLIEAGWTAEHMDEWRRLPRGTPQRDSLERAATPLAQHSAAEELARTVAAYPRYFAAIRATTLAVDTASAVTGAIRRGLRRLSELYPEARYPDVYFLIGKLTSGGTVGPSGMLIGTEQLSSGPDTPRDELPQWEQAATRTNSFAQLPGLVVHEAVHSLQASRAPRKLLERALREGVPDFLSELVVGPWHAESERQRYGRAHEREVWLDFKDEMLSDSTTRTWMYNGTVLPPRNHGATDIGYWVGYAIAKKYYERAADKRAAVRELILVPDAERLLRDSGYPAYAESLP